MTKQSRISEGVDGSDGATAAPQWAAFEEHRVGAERRLVNVFTDHFPMDGFYPALHPAGSIGGHAVLREACCPVVVMPRSMETLPGDRVRHEGARA